MSSLRKYATTPAPLLLCAATLLLLGGCTGPGAARASDASAAPGTPTSTPTSSPAPTSDPGPATPELISYAGDGSDRAVVRTITDANNLAGGPGSFKKFIGRTAERVTQNGTCEGRDVRVTVQTLRTDGYAAGAVHECDSYLALWAIVNGDWKEIDATKDLWDCTALAEHRVPSVIAGDTCYDRETQAQQSYQQS